MINRENSQPSGSDTYPIAVLGGRRTGKTSLCASLHQCLITRSHGFTPKLIARFPDAAGLQHFEQRLAQLFSAPHTIFQSQPIQGTFENFNIGIDFSINKRSFLEQLPDHLKGFYQFSINDLTGKNNMLELLSLSDYQNHPTIQEAQNTFYSTLYNAKSLIICHPAQQNLAPSEANGFIHLMSDIAAGRYGSFEHIVIAFTKYERLFTSFGVKALETAVKPATIMNVMAKTISSDHALETGLRALLGLEPGKPHLYCIPVSTYGFLSKMGAPNYDRRTQEPIASFVPLGYEQPDINPIRDAKPFMRLAGITIPIEKETSEKAGNKSILGPSWLPFLTADPFLTAISGKPSQFMLPLDNFISVLDHKTQFVEKNARRA